VVAFDWTSVPAFILYLGGLATAVLAIVALGTRIRGWLWPPRDVGQARISVFPGPIDGKASEDGIAYTVPVQNAPDSSGGASRISVELVDPQKRTVGTSSQVDRLVPGERAFVGVTTPSRDRYTGPYEIVFEWNDGRPKRNRLASGVTVGEPA
jgi:hypothetical protein